MEEFSRITLDNVVAALSAILHSATSHGRGAQTFSTGEADFCHVLALSQNGGEYQPSILRYLVRCRKVFGIHPEVKGPTLKCQRMDGFVLCKLLTKISDIGISHSCMIYQKINKISV